MDSKHSLKGTRFESLEKKIQASFSKKRGRSDSDDNEKEETHNEPRKTFKKVKKIPQEKKQAPPSSSSSNIPKKSAPSQASKQTPTIETAYNNDRTVYIQGLPFASTEEEIKEFFSKVGSIVSVRLPKWHDSGKLKGYGHIEFSKAAEATKALDLSGEYIQDRYITVDKPMVPRAISETMGTTLDSSTKTKPPGCKTIFIKNLPYEVTEQEIREKFMVYGPIMKIRLAVWNHTNNLKGFGYIEYKREDSAEIAVKKSGSITLKDRMIVVDYETSGPKGGYKGLPNKK